MGESITINNYNHTSLQRFIAFATRSIEILKNYCTKNLINSYIEKSIINELIYN